MTDPLLATTRASRLDRVLAELLEQSLDVEAAAVVSYDGLPMASALPVEMDEDRVAAMSAALLSLGERATEGLGRGELSQVFIEGEHGTVFLVSCEDEAVLVAVARRGAKTGLVLYEVRHAAGRVAGALRDEEPPAYPAPTGQHHRTDEPASPAWGYPPQAVPAEQPWS
jgi:predicted regulator of Ras-like GTPase activity (Roadblock/LC7/MglB family)